MKRIVESYTDFVNKINEQNNLYLYVHFNTQNDFERAKDLFSGIDNESEYYADVINDEFKSLGFLCNSEDELNNLEHALEIELYKNKINNYHFESE